MKKSLIFLMVAAVLVAVSMTSCSQKQIAGHRPLKSTGDQRKDAVRITKRHASGIPVAVMPNGR